MVTGLAPPRGSFHLVGATRCVLGQRIPTGFIGGTALFTTMASMHRLFGQLVLRQCIVAPDGLDHFAMRIEKLDFGRTV